MILALILGVVGLLAGVAVTYWLMQQKLEAQEREYLEQSRQLQNNLENSHESRMQATIKSLQSDYDNELNKTKEQLEAAHQLQIQATIESWQNDHHNQLKKLEATHELRMQEAMQSLQSEQQIQFSKTTEELETAHQSRMQATIQSLQADYQNQIQQLEIAHESRLQETINSLEAKYEAQLQQAERGLDLPPETAPIQSDLPEQLESEQEVIASPITAGEVKITDPSDTGKNTQQELGKKLLAWGETGSSIYISPLMELLYHSDSYIREIVALSLGKITAYKSSRSELDRVIAVLGKLSKDPSASVRKSAVEALGKIKSERVIPFIQNALRDADGNVVKSASAALNQVKFYRVSQGSKAAKPQGKR